MIEYFGFFGLAAIVISLLIIYLRRKSREKAMSSFYQDYSLILTTGAPPLIRQHLDAIENLNCRQGIMNLPNGRQLPFFWWEWFTKTYRPAARGSANHYEFFLAVSFAPQTVSEKFIRKTITSISQNQAGVNPHIKDFFKPDIKHPLRAETLADGSFLIYWQILKVRENLEAKITWLTENILAGGNPGD